MHTRLQFITVLGEHISRTGKKKVLVYSCKPDLDYRVYARHTSLSENGKKQMVNVCRMEGVSHIKSPLTFDSLGFS